MNIVFVLYAFLLGTAMDIGRTIGTAEAAAGLEIDMIDIDIVLAAGSTETAPTSVGKSAKKTKNSPQQQHEPTPTVLAVQAGPDCSITQDAGTGIYTLRAILGNATTLFSERPVRAASTLATPTFVERFAGYFNTSLPNAAITFAGVGVTDATTVSSSSDKPLIAVLSQPSLFGTTRLLDYIGNNPAKGGLFSPSLLEDRYTGIEYTLTQSDSQAAVGPIQQFLDTSGSSCSIFIDGFIESMS